MTDPAVGVTAVEPSATRAALGLGSNLGDRAATLRAAIADIAGWPGSRIAAVSPVYETDPVGGPVGQGPYLNAVVLLDTRRQPHELLTLAHATEQAQGRVRGQRWGARTLDVDVLAVGNCVVHDESLTVPHPRAHLRRFVLVPWADVDPDFVVPGKGDVGTLLDELAAEPGSTVRRRDDVSLQPAPGTSP